MQIMVPQDVLPTQCDFEEDGIIHPVDIATGSVPGHISGQEGDMAQILLPGMNTAFLKPCFL